MNKAQMMRMARRNSRSNAVDERRLAGKLRTIFRKLKIKNNLNIDWDSFHDSLTQVLSTNAKRKISLRVSEFMQIYNSENSRIPIVTRKISEKYHKELAKKVTRIEESTRERIAALVKDGREKGLTFEEMTQSINKNIEHISMARSRVIAITETGNISNAADNEMAVDLGFKMKTWIHVGSGKSDRLNHFKLNMKSIPINEKFDLGDGIEALYPHDSNLPAGEIVNCHCLIIYEE